MVEVLGAQEAYQTLDVGNINVVQLRVWAQRAAGQLQTNETPGFGQMAPVTQTGDCGGEDPAWSLRKRKQLWQWKVPGRQEQESWGAKRR